MKIVLIGKESDKKEFVEAINDGPIRSIGMDFFKKEIDGVDCQIWDTAGMRSTALQHLLKDADAVVYANPDAKTKETADKILENVNSECKVVEAGNDPKECLNGLIQENSSPRPGM